MSIENHPETLISGPLQGPGNIQTLCHEEIRSSLTGQSHIFNGNYWNAADRERRQDVRIQDAVESGFSMTDKARGRGHRAPWPGLFWKGNRKGADDAEALLGSPGCLSGLYSTVPLRGALHNLGSCLWAVISGHRLVIWLSLADPLFRVGFGVGKETQSR